MIKDPLGVLTLLLGIAALFFYLERNHNWALFRYFPPLIFIYALPMVLSNTSLIPSDLKLYGELRTYALPFLLILLLLEVDVGGAVRVMGRGILVMLAGTIGVVLGGPLAYLVVKNWLSPDAWKGYGALAGSWIGGTGNMLAASEALGAPEGLYGLAVLADNVVYLIWLPLLLASRNWSKAFARFTGVSHEQRVAEMESAAGDEAKPAESAAMRHWLYLAFLGLAGSWLAFTVGDATASWWENTVPETVRKAVPIITSKSVTIMAVTAIGLCLSTTRLRQIPGSHDIAMALLYMFVAVMGASSSVKGFGQAIPFVLGAFIWIFIHGICCLIGARLLRVDVHTAAIASAANIGGAASAPVVASYHNEKLVPVSILMALFGYAIGNYAALLSAQLMYALS